jgi:hypothetical protein
MKEGPVIFLSEYLDATKFSERRIVFSIFLELPVAASNPDLKFSRSL